MKEPSLLFVKVLVPVLLVTLGITLAFQPQTGAGGVAAEPTVSAAEPTYTFTSIPDWLNNDLGDVSERPGWDPDDGNSINPAYAEALGVVLDDLQAATPSGDVLVAGDMVEGHWGMDSRDTRIFGPVRTSVERVAAMKAAAQLYYSQWTERFTSRGLRVFGAVGDHDIGDNPWAAKEGKPAEFNTWLDWKGSKVRAFKNQWAKHFTDSGTRFTNHPEGTNFDKTAYAVNLHPEVLLITVDHFRKKGGQVIFELSKGQMDWLRSVLAGADEDWIIVQGHNPVLRPVRMEHSSGGMYRGGGASEFWRLMENHRVDLYFAGEVHATTVKRKGGVTQISHGGLMRKGDAMFLKGVVSGTTLTLTAHEWPTDTYPLERPLWQTNAAKDITRGVTYEPGPLQVGSLILTSENKLLEADGNLTPGCDDC